MERQIERKKKKNKTDIFMYDICDFEKHCWKPGNTFYIGIVKSTHV